MAKNKVETQKGSFLDKILDKIKRVLKSPEIVCPGTQKFGRARAEQRRQHERQCKKFFSLIKKFLKSVPSEELQELLSEIMDKFIDLYIVPSGFSEKPSIEWHELTTTLNDGIALGKYHSKERKIYINQSLLQETQSNKIMFLVDILGTVAHEFQHHLQCLKLHEEELNETTRVQLNEVLTYQSITEAMAKEKRSKFNAETFYALWDLALRKEFEETSSKSKPEERTSERDNWIKWGVYLKLKKEVNARWASDIYLQRFVESLPKNFPNKTFFADSLFKWLESNQDDAEHVEKLNNEVIKKIEGVTGNDIKFSRNNLMDLAIRASKTRARFDFQANRYYLLQGEKYKDSVWLDRMRDDVRKLLQKAVQECYPTSAQEFYNQDIVELCVDLVKKGFCEAAKIVLDEALAICEDYDKYQAVYFAALGLFDWNLANKDKVLITVEGKEKGFLSIEDLRKNVKEEFSKRYYETLRYNDVTEASFDFIYLLNSDQLNDIISQYIKEGKFDFVTQIMYINDTRLKLFTTQKLEISPDLGAIESRLERLQNQVENGEACYDDINDLICFIDYLCLGSVPDYHLESYSPFDQEAFADVKMPATSANDKDYQFKQTLFNLYRKAEWLGYQQAKIIYKQKYNRELTPLDYRYHHGTDRQEFLLPKEEEDKRIEKLYGENQRKYIEMFENEWSTTEKVEEHAENK